MEAMYVCRKVKNSQAMGDEHMQPNIDLQ